MNQFYIFFVPLTLVKVDDFGKDEGAYSDKHH